MGFADRDYNRVDPTGYGRPMRPRGFGGMRMLSVTTWLIIINVAVFILNLICIKMQYAFIIRLPVYANGEQIGVEPHAMPWVDGIGHFSVGTAIDHLQIWRFLTFQFLHANRTHLFFNMLGLFFFGPMVESYLGARRYLLFYLLCGIAGAVTYVILWSLHFLISDPWVPLVGASAGIFGVLIAGSQMAPNTTVLIYGIIPMRLRVFALVLLGVAAYTVLFQGNNAGGEAAHLGGAALGYLLISKPRILDLLTFRRKPREFSQY